MVPRLGVSAVHPVINALLISADERQRAAAARALAAWCLDEGLAARIWEEGHDSEGAPPKAITLGTVTQGTDLGWTNDCSRAEAAGSWS